MIKEVQKPLPKAQQGAAGRSDRRLVLYVAGAMLAAIVVFCMLAPSPATNNDQPTVDNTETRGTRASYLLLEQLGFNAVRWAKPVTELSTMDARKTTLLLVEPRLPLKDRDLLKRDVAEFLSRGGRVVATGENGATLLPGGESADSEHGDLGAPAQAGVGNSPAAAAKNLLDFCRTTPEGASVLAQAGAVTMEDETRWAAKGPQFRVAERCGPDAVVVAYRYGAGEAVWWASPLPLTNGGLAGQAEAKGNPEQAANLRLVLASVGNTGRTVLYDEYLHTWHEGIVEDGRHLPTWFIVGQAVFIAVLLLVSLGRRSGPVWMPVALTRTSPVEFAASMGRLYQRAGATGAVIEAADGRLKSFLTEQCGVAPEILRAGPEAVGNSLAGRFGGDYAELESHMRQAQELAGGPMKPRAALALVKALEADEAELRVRLSSKTASVS